MPVEEGTPSDRARAYRTRRLAEIGRAWGLTSRPQYEVADWVPRASESDTTVLVPGFVHGALARAVEAVCRELRVLGFGPEDALFWLTAPNRHLSRRVPIDVVELGHAGSVIRVAQQHLDGRWPRFLAPAAAAERLNISLTSVLDHIDSGHLPAYRVGRLWRIDQYDFERFQEETQPQVDYPVADAGRDLRELDALDLGRTQRLEFAAEAAVGDGTYPEVDC